MSQGDRVVRAATTADWPAIWPIFAATVRAGETYTYPEDLTSAQACRLWLEPPPAHTVVLTEAGQVLGTARMGPNRPGRGDHIGTAGFMVDPAARGRGVGRALAEWVVDWHRDQGFRGIQFNAVVETNTAAVRLWQDLGFRIVGTVPGAFRSAGHGYVGLHVMFLDLSVPGRDPDRDRDRGRRGPEPTALEPAAPEPTAPGPTAPGPTAPGPTGTDPPPAR